MFPDKHTLDSEPDYGVVGEINAGIVESLRKLLKDEDITVRQKTTECLYVMSCKFTNVLMSFCPLPTVCAHACIFSKG